MFRGPLSASAILASRLLTEKSIEAVRTIVTIIILMCKETHNTMCRHEPDVLGGHNYEMSEGGEEKNNSICESNKNQTV